MKVVLGKMFLERLAGNSFHRGPLRVIKCLHTRGGKMKGPPPLAVQTSSVAPW